MQHDASSEDELQRVSTLLLQPSPVCSPAIHGLSSATLRLPTGDSLPPSSHLGPSHAEHEAASMGSFELPPATNLSGRPAET